MTYKGTPIRLSKDFTEETLRPEERDTFKTMKGNNNNNKKYIYIMLYESPGILKNNIEH